MIKDDEKQAKLQHHLEQILKLIEPASADGTLREGLAETPKRTAKAFSEWFGGYDVDIPALFKSFEDGAPNPDKDPGMVVVRNIEIYSKCEHHMADIIGTCTIAYIPNGRVVGLSKLARLADAFARRLQVQERLTEQIADAIMEHLEPLGCAVRIEAEHMCMKTRGVKKFNSDTVTTQLRGVFMQDPTVRREWLAESKS